jgi:hypothetical protein
MEWCDSYSGGGYWDNEECSERSEDEGEATLGEPLEEPPKYPVSIVLRLLDTGADAEDPIHWCTNRQIALNVLEMTACSSAWNSSTCRLLDVELGYALRF